MRHLVPSPLDGSRPTLCAVCPPVKPCGQYQRNQPGSASSGTEEAPPSPPASPNGRWYNGAAVTRWVPLLVPLLVVAGSAEPLQLATSDFFAFIEAGDADAVRHFLEAGMSPNASTEDSRAIPALTWAVTHEQREIVELLVSAGADLEATGALRKTALLSAAEGTQTASLRVLIGAGADVNAVDRYGATVLMWATARPSTEAVALLLEAGADVNAQMPTGISALHWAVGNRHDYTALLLEAGADPNLLDAERRSALDIASDAGTMSTLLAHGANRENRDKDGWTPLMRVVRERRLDLTRMLIRGRVDVNATSDLGWSPIALACAAGNSEIVSVLIAGGADVNVSTPTAETPLIWSSRRGDLDVVIELLAAGADPNVSSSGITPLMWAVINGHDRVARRLVGAGADPRMVNDAGLDAAGPADRFNQPDLSGWMRRLVRALAQ